MRGWPRDSSPGCRSIELLSETCASSASFHFSTANISVVCWAFASLHLQLHRAARPRTCRGRLLPSPAPIVSVPHSCRARALPVSDPSPRGTHELVLHDRQLPFQLALC